MAFLCKAGDVDDLIKVLQYIRNMNRTDLDSMRKEAFLTARQYNESSVAEKYLENVLINAT